MIKIINGGVYYTGGALLKENVAFMVESKKQKAVKGTLSYGILSEHSVGDDKNLKIRFDYLISDGLTYADIIKAATAAGMREFPVPYTLVDRSFGADGADCGIFGLSAAKKYGGNFVPANLAITPRYACETQAKCGAMLLGSDENTRCGALGTMAVASGCGEVIKQLLSRTYDIAKPPVIAVYMRGKPAKGVGPHDVALALIAATYKKGFLKNKVLEFIGPGIKNLSMDFRIGIDVMTSGTSCLSTVWETDEICEEFYKSHGRADEFRLMKPADPAYYDGAVTIDLSRIDPMISLSFRPFEAFTIKEFLENADDILSDKSVNGGVKANCGIIAGCGGSYENIAEASEILKGGRMGAEFGLCVYPQSGPVFKCLADNGYISALAGAGAAVNSPQIGSLNLNTAVYFKNVRGVEFALMDARSVAATAANGGFITPATEAEYTKKVKKYFFDGGVYDKKVYRGAGKPDLSAELACDDITAGLYEQTELKRNVLMKAVGVSEDGYTVSADEVTDKLGIEIKPDTLCAACVTALKTGGRSALFQRTHGCIANVASEYDEPYRSELIYWGMLPLVCRKFDFKIGDYIYIENLPELIKSDCSAIPAKHISGGKVKNIMLEMPALSGEEKGIILSGSLINYCKRK